MPSPRAARSLDEALGQALEDLEAGLTPVQVLDRYPQYETELAPLLETAYRLRTSRWPTLSMAARVAGRERMHAALIEQKARRHFLVPPVWRQIGAGLALMVLAGTTYFASPVSPLRSLNRPGLTATALLMTTATWTAVAPSPTFEERATVLAVATPVPSPTLRVRNTAEPTEAIDRGLFWTRSSEDERGTAQPAATPTRARPTLAATVTTDVTPVSTLGASPTVGMPAAPAATPEPSTATPGATIGLPSATPSTAPTATNTRVRPPTATRTASPTEEPEPTHTPTMQPSITPEPTETPRPSVTSQPTLVQTPEVSSTPFLWLPTRTRRPTHTPESSPTPQLGPASDSPASLGKYYVRNLRDAAQPGTGLGLRNALQEWRKAQPPRMRKARP